MLRGERTTARACSRAGPHQDLRGAPRRQPRRLPGAPGRARSVIGRNGAGKTTFFNLLTGVLPPSSGHILFKGADITGLPAHAVSRLGIARSYQITNIFGDLTVFENVRIAAQSRVTHYRFWGDADRLAAVNERADEILRHLGLSAKRHVRGAELSHGEQRYLEIGIALATDPEFLLLDEPTAGMSPERRSGRRPSCASSPATSPSWWSSTTWTS